MFDTVQAASQIDLGPIYVAANGLIAVAAAGLAAYAGSWLQYILKKKAKFLDAQTDAQIGKAFDQVATAGTSILLHAMTDEEKKNPALAITSNNALSKMGVDFVNKNAPDAVAHFEKSGEDIVQSLIARLPVPAPSK